MGKNEKLERKGFQLVDRSSIDSANYYIQCSFFSFFLFSFRQTIPLIAGLVKFVSFLSFVKDIRRIQTRKKYGFAEENNVKLEIFLARVRIKFYPRVFCSASFSL